MILEEAHGDFNDALNILISMCPVSSNQGKSFYFILNPEEQNLDKPVNIR